MCISVGRSGPVGRRGRHTHKTLAHIRNEFNECRENLTASREHEMPRMPGKNDEKNTKKKIERERSRKGRGTRRNNHRQHTKKVEREKDLLAHAGLVVAMAVDGVATGFANSWKSKEHK